MTPTPSALAPRIEAAHRAHQRESERRARLARLLDLRAGDVIHHRGIGEPVELTPSERALVSGVQKRVCGQVLAVR